MGQRVTALAVQGSAFQGRRRARIGQSSAAGQGRRPDRRRRRDRRAARRRRRIECRCRDRLLRARRGRGRRRALRRVQAAASSIATTGLDAEQQEYIAQGGQEDSDRLVAQHEHGRQCGDEAHRDRRQGAHAICRPASTSKSSSAITASKKMRPAARRSSSARSSPTRWRSTEHTHGRSGRPGARPRNEIGYHAVRAGDNPGEHTIIFGMLGETLELRVAASNRDCYAQGALLAAEWLVGKPPGLYGMNDVLGL